jgi:hypothetical protein
MKLINKHRQPLNLDDGTILAAAGTDGSIKTLESISDRDRRRYVDRGLVAIATEQAVAFEPKIRPATASEEAQEGARRVALVNDDSVSRKDAKPRRDTKPEPAKEESAK